MRSFGGSGSSSRGPRCRRGLSLGRLALVTITADVSTLTINIAFTFLRIGVLASVAMVKDMAFVLSTLNINMKRGFKTGCGGGTRLYNKVVLILVNVGVLLRRLKIVDFWLFRGGDNGAVFSPYHFLSMVFGRLLFIARRLFCNIGNFITCGILSFTNIVYYHFNEGTCQLGGLQRRRIALVYFIYGFFTLVNRGRVTIFVNMRMSTLLWGTGNATCTKL